MPLSITMPVRSPSENEETKWNTIHGIWLSAANKEEQCTMIIKKDI